MRINLELNYKIYDAICGNLIPEIIKSVISSLLLVFLFEDFNDDVNLGVAIAIT